MKYKLLLVDLDGTLVPNLGIPPREFTASPRLTQAIQKAQEQIAISLCTGRDKKTVIEVINKLGLIAPQIIEGGAKIIDARGKDLWAQYLRKDSARKIIEILRKTKTSFSIVVNGIEILGTLPKDNFDKISAILWYDLTQKQVIGLKRRLSGYREIAVSVNKERTGSTVYLTHREGTKAHGVKKLMAILGIKKEETIGVGDGEGDKPLLLSCGLKVAMGNAVQEVKEIADYIAPSVKKDGIADVIEKFVLV